MTTAAASNRSKAIIALILAALVLTGCVKARVEIEVERDGTGTMAVAMGMTQQALSWAGEDGKGVMERLSQEVSGDDDADDVTVRRWTEGNYEWFATSTSLTDLDDLNSRLAEIEMFRNLALTRERGVLRDRYVLDGQVTH
ncbi:MAG: hypothetical protein PVJ55_11850 [Anaerolineae bacterium]|jgi:hypothetical protein